MAWRYCLSELRQHHSEQVVMISRVHPELVDKETTLSFSARLNDIDYIAALIASCNVAIWRYLFRENRDPVASMEVWGG